MPADEPSPPCPYCRGQGVVRAAIDDIEFEFTCVCSGGHQEDVLWLLAGPEDYAI